VPLSPARHALNTSAHTFADLKALAQAEPQAAVTYLQRVEQQLRVAGKVAEADTVKGLLSKTGDLVERMYAAGPQLQTIFPANASDWGKLQAERAAGVGFDAAPAEVPPPQFICGTLSSGPNGLIFTTDGGRELTLHRSNLTSKLFQMGNDMMEGYIGEGRMTLMGTPGEDNASFNVEGFAINTDGNFDTITFGRVAVDPAGTVTINGTRGPVEVRDDHLKEVLSTLPEFAVVVPGEAVESDGKLVHTASPKVMIGLGRFKEPPPQTADGPRVSVIANMANNHFVMKPITFPAEMLGRANHMSRLWVRGWPKFDADGLPSQWDADYLSKQLDLHTLYPPQAVPDADPVHAAVLQEIV
jgi:hypothetical protein